MDCGKDVGIGNQNDSYGGDDDESRENKQHNLIHKGVNTRALDQSWDITEKVLSNSRPSGFFTTEITGMIKEQGLA